MLRYLSVISYQLSGVSIQYSGDRRLLLFILPTPHTPHPTPYTLHPTPYTPHPCSPLPCP
ncbi:MAG: hypothetical protein EWV45_07630 [Microcystis flos-aquae Mf_QC_C_20070823_S10D]|uniref:Uncharacterized protein n=1 Tax=Microcystis flos-aquae Mf_QC_C_20070823_S10D TaxID=2486236 RepID=A0A552KZJ6_9CHRO|nr:MAG: hypothetical protein EWV65_12780 [Microcystis flos-aquae Ma_QC_C_20070823_S18D]TRV13379.1 MAG: hypothetical protein EWV45_07630 [Microcystis flos-aquae Mf_QC_C_20070823_S10D]TRV25784.1 MAG: hypothetical protein EWV72_08575 [Microcystis flos-aquae Mf_QC_C_20070823_S10]TRV33022.1 MAG: hypothetical protein EWV71_17230 [Microcystis flos-aquae Mf_QC_C_20070823_S20D]TRV33963.1 MAG: hypothetical protein EWV44_17105 [Microcystis flos-aquae Mf_QC_C_20070823_S20T]TRV38795.1 MAG: hypothetical pro